MLVPHESKVSPTQVPLSDFIRNHGSAAAASAGAGAGSTGVTGTGPGASWVGAASGVVGVFPLGVCATEVPGQLWSRRMSALDCWANAAPVDEARTLTRHA